MAISTTETRINSHSWVKKLIPVLVSFFILYYYFHDQNWTTLLIGVKKSQVIVSIVAVLAPQLLSWFFEVLITERHMVWFHGTFPLKNFLWVRGAIYLLVMINSSLGFGGVLIYLRRKARIAWSKLLGIMLFRYVLTLWGICVLMITITIVMYFYGGFEKVGINIWVLSLVLILLFVVMIETWFFWQGKKQFGLNRVVIRNPGSEFWMAFRTSTKKQWLLTWAMGIPPLILYLVGIYFQAIAFNIKIPFLQFMLFSPLVMVVSDMPIAFAGFGSTTLAFITFFGNYGSNEAITALTLFSPLVRAIVRTLIGLVSLQFTTQDINTLLQQPSQKLNSILSVQWRKISKIKE